uniref:Peptidase S1 domain-containing protein n=1 Tax=Pelodiscus sinensis TaxID=13735 RepID=K7FLZ0_PELSI
MQRLVVGLLPWTFLLAPGGWAGEIIGGKEALPHSRPYMAYLEIQHGDQTGACGGFLVAENFVMTAAHCQGDGITVVLGAHNISQREPSLQEIQVQRQIPHPQYNRETLNNDIMLLQLSENATLTKEVRLVNFTTGHRSIGPGTTCSVAGWGLKSMRTTTDTLQEVSLSVLTDDLCKKRYYDYFPSTMLCVGDSKYKKSTYKGDSGGPLVCDGVAEGIVCKGKQNNIFPPVVFTRISHFVSWIKANMR